MRMALWIGSGIFVASACSSQAPEVQQELGHAVYITYCQSCHEAPGTGPRLIPAVLASRLTAVRLYLYNKQQMPYNAGGVLSDEDYLNVTAWLLQRADLLGPNELLTVDNMDTISLTSPIEETPRPSITP